MRLLIGIITFVVLCAQTKPAEDPPLAPQPLPFSHKAHSALGVKCSDCHTMKKPGFAAGIPGEQICMSCHTTMKTDSEAVQKLAAYFKSKKPVPWVRVYRVPDYVWFSHESHSKDAGISCETCHGPVAQRDVLTKEKATSMTECMACHAARKAPNACNFCHETR